MIFTVSSAESTCELLTARFRERYGTTPHIFRAPGRVNLIGEHTDYNEGFVMPMAIGFQTWVAAAARDDRVLEVYSDRFDESITLVLDELSGSPRKHWSDFVRGVAAILQAAEHRLRGANFLIHGEVPLGAGLSSSASLEMAVGMALTSLSGISVPRLELVKLCQAAEHDYVGTRCGIMDQFVVGFGTAGHALLLDCRSLDYQLLPIASDVRMIVCNCMVRHELASGEYNRRRKDCETGVKLLGEHLPGIRALRDVALKDLERNNSLLSERVYHRCRHVVTENERVLAATHALQTRDFEQFGELMYRSHASLRDDYEVSCHELDLLVDLATSAHGVYGARMTGGGFGGCTVNLVRAECVDAFQAHIAAAYRKNIGIEPDIYVCEPAQGAEACTS